MASAAPDVAVTADAGEGTEQADTSNKLDSSTSTSDDTIKTSIPRIALIDEHERRRSLDSGSSARSSQSSENFFGSVLAHEPLTEEPVVAASARAASPPRESEAAARLAEENGDIEDTLQQILRDEQALKLKYQKLRELEEASSEWSLAEELREAEQRESERTARAGDSGGGGSGGSGAESAGGSGSAGDSGGGVSIGGGGGGDWTSSPDRSAAKKSDPVQAEQTERTWSGGSSEEDNVRPVASPARRHLGDRGAPPPIAGWDTLPETLIGDGEGDYITPDRDYVTPDRDYSTLERERDYSTLDRDYSTLERMTPGSHDSLRRSRDGSYSPFSLLSTPCHSFLAGPVYAPTGDLPDLTQVGGADLKTPPQTKLGGELGRQTELDPDLEKKMKPESEQEPLPEQQTREPLSEGARETDRERRRERERMREEPEMLGPGPGSTRGRPASIVEHPAWGQISDLDRALAFMEATGPTDCRPTSQRWTDIDDVLSVLEADSDQPPASHGPPRPLRPPHGPMRDSRIEADDDYRPAGGGRAGWGPPRPLASPAADWTPARGRALGLVGYSAERGGLDPHRSAAKPEPPRPSRAVSVSAELNRRLRSLQRARAHSLLADAQLAAGGRISAVHQHIVQSTNELTIPGRSTPATVHSYHEMVIKQVIDSAPPTRGGRRASHPADADEPPWDEWSPHDEPPPPEPQPAPRQPPGGPHGIPPGYSDDPHSVPGALGSHDPSGMHYPSYVSARDFDSLARGVDTLDLSDTDLSAHESAADERALFPFSQRGRPAAHRSAFRPIRPEPLRPVPVSAAPRLIHHLPIASAGPAPAPPPPASHGEPNWDGCGRSSTLPRARPRQPAERGRRSKSERRRRKELRHSERRLRRARYGRSGVAGYRRLTLQRGRRDADFGFSVIGGPDSGLGVFVSRTEPEGLARSAGLRVGDELIIVNGYDVRRFPLQQVQQILSSSSVVDILIKTMGNGDNYVVSHTYTWCDAQGREVTPPPDLLHTSREGGHDRKVDFSLEMGESLGLTIRGGAEYGLGIFVTGVDANSPADQAGIQVGDQILDVNNQSFLDITHDEAVSILKYCKTPMMTIRPVGKVPCASYATSDTGGGRFQTAITDGRATDRGAGHGQWQPAGAAAAPVGRQAAPAPSAAADDGDEWGDPSLVMVYEKASVLLGAHEFGVFDELVRRYLAGQVDVVRLVGSLLELFRAPEKLTLLTELREIVSPADQVRFDQMVYHSDRRRPFEHSAGAGVHHQTGGGAWWRPRQPQIQRSPSDDSGIELPNGSYAAPHHRSLGEEDWPLAARSRVVFHRHVDDPGHAGHGGTGALSPAGALRAALAGPVTAVSRLPDRCRSLTSVPTGDPSFSSDLTRLRPASALTETEMDSYPASPILEDPEGNIKVTIPKNKPLLGIVIEGGANTSQPLPRIVNIQPYGSAFSAGGLMVGQVIKSVDGRRLVGVNHQRAAQLIAEAYANKNKPDIEFVVRELKRSAFNVRHCAPDLTPD
ncbi:uncharacterized protein LOC122372516 [Amphibalanus amphitrite]|uniref:uncharacterized protein LOC122372516 n=1 Tax=Amphibalanus amphitrite TaxID=1232801 RepID=UPI001C924B40|nr:uncharacterized protein LOC122372516 [Amphibalanus amphitrite]